MAAAADAIDRIGDLPDVVLIDIISRLPTDYMVRTSVLSSRWRRLWTSSPVLKLTGGDYSRANPVNEDLSAIVDLCLHQRSPDSTLRFVRFPIVEATAAAASNIDRWIRFVSAAGVEILALIPCFNCGHLEIPPSLFTCSLLSTLGLHRTSVPSSLLHSAEFRFLRTLILTRVLIHDDGMAALLSACPRIEHLSLSYMRQITSLTIRASEMRHLMVHKCNKLKWVELPDVPELRRLMYHGDISAFCDLEGVALKLQEAALLSEGYSDFQLEHWKGIVTFISNVRMLYVNSWLFEFTLFQHQVFENLKELHWWPVFSESVVANWCVEVFADSLRLLILFLRDCPSLEKLCILCPYDLNQDFINPTASDDDEDYNDDEDPLGEFEGIGYQLPRLKSIRLTQFSYKKAEMRLLKFVGDKAVILESMNLHYVEEVRHQLKEIRKKLRAIHRISPAARILISEYDEKKVCPKHENMWFEFMKV